MVAGCLDQHTCPRSRCAARQPRAPAASRLRGPPDAAAARSERPGARTQALLPRASPLLSTMERAQLRPPARARKGGELSYGSAQDAAGEVEAKAEAERLPDPALRCRSSRNLGGDGDNHNHRRHHPPRNSRDILEWDEGPPQDRSERRSKSAHIFLFPIFPGVLPYTLLVTHFPHPEHSLRLLQIPRWSSPHVLYNPEPAFFPSETMAQHALFLCLPASLSS